MRIVPLAAAVAAVLAAAARADDPPPKTPPAPAQGGAAATGLPRHENKVSPEAKAAFEKMAKAMYSPVAKGLKELSGTLLVPAGPAGDIALKVSFKAPDSLHVEADAQSPMGAIASQACESLLRLSLGMPRPSDEAEYDAEVATKDGKQVLTITRYRNGAESGRTEMTLGDDGLVAETTTRAEVQTPGSRRTVSRSSVFTWGKVGDLSRLEKLEEKRGAMQDRVVQTLHYTDVDGISLLTSWKTEFEGMAMPAREVRYSELTVNGKKVDLQAPATTPPERKGPEAPEKDGGADKAGGK